MNAKVDSIVLRIRNLERRLMDKKFVGGLSHWNPLLELQSMLVVRQTLNDGDHGGWYVVLPTKECVGLLNKLSRAENEQEANYLLLQISDRRF